VSERAQLHLVNTTSGESHPSAYTGLTLHELNELLERKERELIGYRLRCGKLERELAEQHSTEPEAEDVKQVLLYWRPRCMPKAKVVPASPRWKKVRDRLHETDVETGEPYTVVQLCEAVEGALLSDYHRAHGYLDAETIFRDSGTVDRHIARFRSSDALPAPVLPPELRGQGMAYLLERCSCGHLRLEHSRSVPPYGFQGCLSPGCECIDYDQYAYLVERFVAQERAA
jgi:hypothetical protein